MLGKLEQPVIAQTQMWVFNLFGRVLDIRDVVIFKGDTVAQLPIYHGLTHQNKVKQNQVK